MSILAALLVIGFAAGLMGAILGLGGGIFLVPALSLLLHVPIHLAVGASLLGVIATSAGVAAVELPRRGADLRLALRLELATTAGAIIGGLLAGEVSSATLHIVFAVVVLASAGYVVYQRHGERGAQEQMFVEEYHPRHWPTGATVALGAGLVSGLLGVGGGFIKVPVLYAVMGVPLGVATATSNFMVGITAAASYFVYYGRGDVYPAIAIPTSLGVLGGAMLGVRVVMHLRAVWVRWTLVVVLLAIGARMLMQGLRP